MRAFSAIFLLIIVSGCITTSPYRTESGNTCEYKSVGDCHAQSITRANFNTDGEYILSFLEYDEQGMLHNAVARKEIVEMYQTVANQEDVLLITFFHGWHHNAKGSEEDSDIVNFREVLAKAAETHSDKTVLGIYMGWRGRSLVGLLDYLTFWGRKHTAHEVGQLGGATETLLEFESIINQSNRPNSRMITIGHSFGAAALYSSIGNVLAERFVSSRGVGDGNLVDGFGDLVVLLNPAFEASRYTSLFELAQRDCQSYSDRQVPRLLVLSSEADIPVGWIFQAGQFFNAVTEEHRNTATIHCTGGNEQDYQLRQFRADVNGVGHYRPFLTHDLRADSSIASFSNRASDLSLGERWSGDVESGSVPFNLTVLSTRNITTRFNPYLNIYTDENVMNGHNDIWTDEVLDFLNESIRVSTLY